MNTEQIKAAVQSGQTVHWASLAYRVMLDEKGQWLIYCDWNGDCQRLEKRDGSLNGKPEQFFLA